MTKKKLVSKFEITFDYYDKKKLLNQKSFKIFKK